jgi:uroporphyrinogen decarboxylase
MKTEVLQMQKYNVPLLKPHPDIDNFIRGIKGEITPAKPLVCEYLVDDILMKQILTQNLGREWIEKSDKTEYMGGQMNFDKTDISIINHWLDNQIAFWYHMGYDYVRVEVSLPLPAVSLVTQDTAEGNQDHVRAWQGLDEGPIKTWDDFESYPWPSVTEETFYIHKYICDHLPDGMGFISCHAGGVYEHVSRLMGYTAMCIALVDSPDLVKAIADKLGGIIKNYNDGLLQFNRLAAIFQGDDFGFNTQTLISPDDIRKYFLPWHKIFAKQAHDAGRLYFLHSCGKVDTIMEDLIEDVKIDGKHSFQDNVIPAGEFKKRWGDRIAILGGIDVHRLSTDSPDNLRMYVRKVIDDCANGGRFAVGAGNSVPSYVPIENYLTLMDEALR